ncbi:hypothetical protein [Klebsiella sp. BIGb0407]|uniref:hypothetical protein n=1 Tax=Klebsiella sp. BIGb0407 TaxID=2940603 RepID=UPI00216715FF|nr:hypothetical protein [Klebsiella sp. BIGb0407]MCS3434025.1 hypothetical protein [Klebsiella sp. BIGb0407]
MSHINKIEQNILYTQKKIKYYLYLREFKLKEFYFMHLNFPGNKYTLPKETQIFSDALLQGMATLIDYYFIWVSMKLGCQNENIVKIQYKSFDDNQIINSYNRANKSQFNTTTLIINEINSEILKLSGKKSSEVIIHNYWAYYFKYAICSEISKWGASFKTTQSERSDEYENLVGDVVFKYYTYLNPFFSNYNYSMAGAKYNIYLTINNYLKHNTVPIIIPSILNFGEEKRIFSHFEIKNEDSFFLKDSLLKNILTHDFESLKKELDNKSAQKNKDYPEQSPIMNTSFIDFIKLDKVNGHINETDGSLLFFLDGVSFTKTKNSLLIDAGYSLKETIFTLFRTIEDGMKTIF